MRCEIEPTHKQQREEKDSKQIPTQLLVAPDDIEAAVKQEMVHREVDARQQHKHDADALDIIGLEIADAGLMRAETTSGDGREGMAHRIELVHGSKVIEEGAKQGKCNINKPKQARGGPHGWGKLLHAQARGFSSKERYLLRAFGHRWEKSQSEHHHTQSAHPLHDAAPEQDAVRLLVDVVENGGTRGRKARHGLKESVGHIVDSAIHQERQHAEQGKQYPRQSHHHERITDLQATLFHRVANIVEQ